MEVIEAAETRSKEPGMSTSARPVSVRFDTDSMWVKLDDGRTVGVPLAWFPRLLHGSQAERREVSLSPSGLHWGGAGRGYLDHRHPGRPRRRHPRPRPRRLNGLAGADEPRGHGFPIA